MRTGWLILSLCSVLLFLPETASAGPGGTAPPDPATEEAGAIRDVYWVALATSLVVLVLVEAALLLFVVRFRSRPETSPDVEGPQIHGNTRLEVVWTIAPAVALLGLAVFTLAKTPAVQGKRASAGGEVLRIRVEAHQFYWQYVYPGGAVSLDLLRLPLGRRVTLELVSFDVAHSWWVPELGGKLDAIPGKVNRLHFRPARAGVFRDGKCAEFCGIQHAVMATTVEVVEPRKFNAWISRLRQTQGSGTSNLGRQTYEAACAKCHGPEGEGDIGPQIAGSGTITNRTAMRRLLLEGQDTDAAESYMPPVGRGWPERQFEALLQYLRASTTLSGEKSRG
ncbi:MAG: cytochrome c oxidase subunit II [Vicinamibacteria bacterium]